MTIGFSDAVSQVLDNFNTRNTYYFYDTTKTLSWITTQIEDPQTINLMDVYELLLHPVFS
jgi:hypothetical protein